MRPGERLIVCRNPDLARERRRKPEALLAATARSGGARRRGGAPAIGLEVGAASIGTRWPSTLRSPSPTIASASPAGRAIAAEAALDGLDDARTSLPPRPPTSGPCAPTSRSPSSNGVPLPEDVRPPDPPDLPLAGRPGAQPSCSLACSPTTSSGTCACAWPACSATRPTRQRPRRFAPAASPRRHARPRRAPSRPPARGARPGVSGRARARRPGPSTPGRVAEAAAPSPPWRRDRRSPR